MLLYIPAPLRRPTQKPPSAPGVRHSLHQRRTLEARYYLERSSFT